jgi:hypothetical protein
MKRLSVLLVVLLFLVGCVAHRREQTAQVMNAWVGNPPPSSDLSTDAVPCKNSPFCIPTGSRFGGGLNTAASVCADVSISRLLGRQ